jgi:hypothetical protein
VPSLEQIRGVLAVLPHATEIERRNRGVIALTLLTGMRDGALASLKLKHIDLAAAKVLQDARQVHKVFQKLHDLVLSCGRRHSCHYCGVGRLSAGPEALGR